MNPILLYTILSRPHYTRIEDLSYFYKLKDRKKVWNEENIELNVGVGYLIHSPYSDRYFKAKVTDYTNVEDLKNKIYQGNIYKLN